MQSNPNSHISGDAAKWYGHLGTYSQDLTKLNIYLTIPSANSNSRYLPKSYKNIHPQEHLYANAHRIFTHNSQKTGNTSNAHQLADGKNTVA